MLQVSVERALSVGALIEEYSAFKQPKVTLARLRGCVNNLEKLLPDDALENWQRLPSRLVANLADFSDSTRRFKLGIVRDFLRFCVVFHGADPRAPLLISLPPDPVPDPHVLRFEECRDVLRTAFRHSREARLFVTLCLYHGLRRSEALNIWREDFDLAEGVLWIRWRPSARLKTRSSAREIPIPSAALPLLTEALSGIESGRVIRRCTTWPSHIHLPHGAGATLMRHTYASALISGRVRVPVLDEAGEVVYDPEGRAIMQLATVTPRPDYWQVSRWLGHSNVNTLRYYAGLSDGVPGLDPRDYV